MILSNWPNGVNSKFYSYSDKPKSNTETIEYKSGRVVTWQKNTKKTKEIKCKLCLKIADELPLFWAWFNDTLGQTAGAFTCSALGSSYYRFTNTPEPEDTDTTTRVLNIELEEV